MATKKPLKKKALIPSMTIKSEKVNHFIYVLSNGQELTFKDQIFPTSINQIDSKGQLKMF